MAAMGWVSVTVLKLDRAQVQARGLAEHEEKVRLALWRMESLLAPLVAEESGRPFFHYSAFHTVDQTYSKGQTASGANAQIPSPLLSYSSSNVLLHFEFDQAGQIASPQVPTGPERELAEKNYVNPSKIDVGAARLRDFQEILSARASDAVVRALMPGMASRLICNGDVLTFSCPPFRTNAASLAVLNAPIVVEQQRQQELLQQPLAQLNPSQIPNQAAQAQSFRNSAEWNARANVYQQAAQQVEMPSANYLTGADFKPMEGPLKPVWVGPALVLARRVVVDGRTVVQGAWLNWEHLRGSLLENIQDLLPRADLQPVLAPNGTKEGRALAALPAKVVVLDPIRLAMPVWTPIRASLLIAWLCVGLAAAAVAFLLHGAVSLSERRGAFVSAVTHELRTPLTTFKMYSEMLAAGMVTDEARRKQYLETLCSEANRLGHLVENVLAYARLERGSARSRVEKISLADLVERIAPRLRQRAEQTGMGLSVDLDDEAGRTVVQVDAAAVEQVLFNLVDNACKYAAPKAADKVIHLEAGRPGPRFAILRVRDHGDGISAEAARELFRPFRKSAHQAAASAPGVGLGLALCRRLSRSMGGDLRLDRFATGGACFELTLPLGSAQMPSTHGPSIA